MKTIVTAAAATLFTASVSAADFYYGFGKGNTDLMGASLDSDVTAVQPSVGDSYDHYEDFTDGHPDLHQSIGPVSTVGHSASDGGQPIYVGPGRTL
jgi:hypothetical protein